jgi:hypothetical protein
LEICCSQNFLIQISFPSQVNFWFLNGLKKSSLLNFHSLKIFKPSFPNSESEFKFFSSNFHNPWLSSNQISKFYFKNPANFKLKFIRSKSLNQCQKFLFSRKSKSFVWNSNLSFLIHRWQQPKFLNSFPIDFYHCGLIPFSLPAQRPCSPFLFSFNLHRRPQAWPNWAHLLGLAQRGTSPSFRWTEQAPPPAGNAPPCPLASSHSLHRGNKPTHCLSSFPPQTDAWTPPLPSHEDLWSTHRPPDNLPSTGHHPSSPWCRFKITVFAP